MARKIGVALLCVLLTAMIYAATRGGFSNLASALDDSSNAAVDSTAMQTALAAAVAPDQTPVSLASELPTHDPTVGKLAGSAGTSGGAASYSIPIALPPGRRGMQPSLSLNYSSRAGNGIAGMGWSLSGLSSLHRCPSTLDQDNQVRAVALNNGDKLCLDGQRLLATAGAYGASGTTYDTELESFVRVTQLGGDLQSAQTYFKVETKSGEILWYGNNSAAANPARVVPGGVTVPLSWMLVRKEDRIGNFLRYAYTDYGNGEVLVNSILYTGFGAIDGTRHVDFTYEARPATDTASSYLAQGLTLQTQRLTQITTYLAAQAVRQYRLRFDASSAYSGRTLLRGVTDCGIADGATTAAALCHPETKFAWQESSVQSRFHALTIPGLPTGQQFSSITPIGDLDGDGVPELLAHYSDYTHQSGGTNYLISLNADRTVRSVVDAAGLGPAFATNASFGAPLDFNKDGRTDLISYQTIGTSQHVFATVWNNSTTAFVGSAFTTYDLGLAIPAICGNPVFADLNGDGFTDVIVSTPTSGNCTGSSTQTASVYLGKAGPSAGVPMLQSTPASTRALPYVMRNDGSIQSYFPSIAQDFDGDGLPDVILTRGALTPVGSPTPSERDKSEMLWFSRVTNGVYTAGGVGNEIASYAAFGTTPLEADETNLQAYTQMIDVNGDGLPDLLSIKIQPDGNGYWSVRLNTGGHFGPRILTTSRRGIENCDTNPADPFPWGNAPIVGGRSSPHCCGPAIPTTMGVPNCSRPARSLRACVRW